MRRGKNYALFGKHTFQHPGIQKYKVGIQEQKNRENVYSHRPEKERQNEHAHRAIVLVVFRFSDNRRRDLDGALSTVLDAIVRAGVLPDDDTRNISAASVTSVKVPKGQEGVDVTVYEP